MTDFSVACYVPTAAKWLEKGFNLFTASIIYSLLPYITNGQIRTKQGKLLFYACTFVLMSMCIEPQ